MPRFGRSLGGFSYRLTAIDAFRRNRCVWRHVIESKFGPGWVCVGTVPLPPTHMKEFLKFTGKVVLALAVYQVAKKAVAPRLPAQVAAFLP